MKHSPGRWVLAALALVLLMGAMPAWRHLRFAYDLRLARAALASDDPQRAVEELETIAARHAGQGEVAYLQSVAHRRLGKTSVARADLKRAAAWGWPRSKVLLQQHMIDFQSGEIEKSEPYLREVLAEGCSDALASQIYECLVKGYLSDIRLQEAELCLGYWLEWRPKSVPARVLKMEILDAKNDTRGLLQECREILELAPDSHQTRLRMAYLLLQGKDVSEAKVQFEACLARRPDDGVARVGLAACQRQLGQTDEAKRALEQALAGELPEEQRSFALAELAQLALSARSYEEARTRLEEALRLSPTNVTARYSLGLVLARLGDKEAAGKNMEESRALEAQAVRLEELIDEIIAEPHNADLRCEAGEILLNQGNRKEAFVWLLSALRTERWHAPTHKALARYYDEVGKNAMAERHRAWAAQSEGAATSEASALPQSVMKDR